VQYGTDVHELYAVAKLICVFGTHMRCRRALAVLMCVSRAERRHEYAVTVPASGYEFFRTMSSDLFPEHKRCSILEMRSISFFLFSRRQCMKKCSHIFATKVGTNFADKQEVARSVVSLRTKTTSICFCFVCLAKKKKFPKFGIERENF
jgi:hypothetical protein